MFERNRIETGAGQETATPATVTLMDGRTLAGRFVHSASRTFLDALNAPGLFIEFETYDGQRTLIAKSQFADIALEAVPAARKLSRFVGSEFDPYAILGVSRETTWEAVRQAYIARTKVYHPDRYAGVDLPVEVRDYLAATAGRINAAYAALEASMRPERKPVVEKAKPIFTSGQPMARPSL